jgi:hypothetical protein
MTMPGMLMVKLKFDDHLARLTGERVDDHSEEFAVYRLMIMQECFLIKGRLSCENVYCL